ncbi:MAG TPA: peptidylprolyl isomerase [Pyrinomonadaceae bacterium]|jgi:peptidyl-prolyl cis-trans isomerase B (cyclophilin B)|nr:peptidylprolyl isomerase [Pyrinomonadaceae bacterium]
MLIAIRLVCLSLCVVCLTAPAQIQKPEAQVKQEASPSKKNARPEAAAAEPFDKATVEQMSKQCVTLDTESGQVVAEMLAEAAPETVRNFLNLAATGAFDTTTFSRVVRGFVIQGGNLSTREKLTPELLRRAVRTVPDEPNAVKHVRGVLSMARSDQPNSATTNFFILVGDASHLDGTFAAFGRVTRGMEVVDAINNAEAEGEKPKHPVRINRATVAPCAKPATTAPPGTK